MSGRSYTKGCESRCRASKKLHSVPSLCKMHFVSRIRISSTIKTAKTHLQEHFVKSGTAKQFGHVGRNSYLEVSREERLRCFSFFVPQSLLQALQRGFCRSLAEIFAVLAEKSTSIADFSSRHFAEATARRADGSRRVLRKIKEVTKCQPALPQTVSIIRKSHTEKQKSHHKPKKSSKMFANTSKRITFAAETNSKPCLTTLHASAITLAFTLRKT